MATTLKAFSRELKSIPDDNTTLPYLFKKYGRLGIKFIYEKDHTLVSPQKYHRIMFGSSVRSDYYKFPFKGAIINSDFKLISLPPSPPIIKYKLSEISRNISEAKITPIVDGTTVTLYYYKNQWVVSTYRGYDIGDYTRLGNVSFKMALMEIFRKYPNFSFSKLQKNHCYTIGFKSKHFHPFIDPSNSNTAWFIRSFNLDTLTLSNEDIGIPRQTHFTIPNISQLITNCKTSLQDYIKTNSINYGYIITLKNRSYLMESSLLKFIRNTFYYTFDKPDLTNYNEVNYRVLKALLNNIDVSTFCKVFSQYKHIYKSLTVAVDALAEVIINDKPIPPNTSNVNSVFIAKIKEKINKTVSFKHLTDRNKLEIIYNFVCIHEYTNDIYNLIFNNNNA